MKYKFRKAKNDYKCYGCKNNILKSQNYWSVTLFPKEEPRLSDVPITEKFCLKCINY